MTPAFRHFVTALLLLTAGAGPLAGGCIMIPAGDKVVAGSNAAKRVGDARSDRPVRVGLSTREDVLRVLGPPAYVAPNGSRAAYGWKAVDGVWFMPVALLFGAPHRIIVPQHGRRLLVLEFDRPGVLWSFYVRKIYGGLLGGNFSFLAGLFAVPEGMVAFEPDRPWPAPATAPATTAPATSADPARSGAAADPTTRPVVPRAGASNRPATEPSR